MNQNDMLKLVNDDEKVSTSDQNMETTQSIETGEDFCNLVLELANTSDDYVAFYKQAQEKYIELLSEGKLKDEISDYYNLNVQFTVRAEALKIANKNNIPLRNFIDKLYKLEIKYRNLVDAKVKETSEISPSKEQKLRMDLFADEREKEILELLEEYKNDTGHYRTISILEPQDAIINAMGYRNGELVEKCVKLKNERGIDVDNKINYSAMFLNHLRPILQTLKITVEMQLEMKLTNEEIKKKLKEMF